MGKGKRRLTQTVIRRLIVESFFFRTSSLAQLIHVNRITMRLYALSLHAPFQRRCTGSAASRNRCWQMGLDTLSARWRHRRPYSRRLRPTAQRQPLSRRTFSRRPFSRLGERARRLSSCSSISVSRPARAAVSSRMRSDVRLAIASRLLLPSPFGSICGHCIYAMRRVQARSFPGSCKMLTSARDESSSLAQTHRGNPFLLQQSTDLRPLSRGVGLEISSLASLQVRRLPIDDGMQMRAHAVLARAM